MTTETIDRGTKVDVSVGQSKERFNKRLQTVIMEIVQILNKQTVDTVSNNSNSTDLNTKVY